MYYYNDPPHVIAHCRWCNERLSDWFIWEGVRHCYPCWKRSGYTLIYPERKAQLAV